MQVSMTGNVQFKANAETREYVLVVPYGCAADEAIAMLDVFKECLIKYKESNKSAEPETIMEIQDEKAV